MDKKSLIQQIEQLRNSRVITSLANEKIEYFGVSNLTIPMTTVPTAQNYEIGGNFQCDQVFTLDSLCNYFRNTSDSFLIADNTSLRGKNNEVAIWTESKYKLESNSFSSGSNIIVPDIFNNDLSITPTGADIMNRLGVTVSLEKNTTATTKTPDGREFNYNNTLLINNTSIIYIHPEVIEERVDLNIIVWYGILKYLKKIVEIATYDKNLSDSAKTFK